MKKRNCLLFVFVLILMSFFNPVSVLAEDSGRDGIPYSIKSDLENYFNNDHSVNSLDEYQIRPIAEVSDLDLDSNQPGNVFGPNLDAEDEASANTYTITLLVDDGNGNFIPYEPGMSLKDGTSVRVSIDWQVTNGNKDFELNLGDLGRLGNYKEDATYHYLEPGKDHGYTVSFRTEEDGTLTVVINYDNECECNGRDVNITFEGQLDLDPRDDKGEEDDSFKIGDVDIPYVPDYTGSKLDVLKEYGNLELDSDGNFYLSYTVTNTVQGKVTNPVFHDDLPDGTELVIESVETQFIPGNIKFNKYDPNPATDGIWNVTVQKSDSENSFEITSKEPGMTLYTGDVIVYTYKIKINPGILGDLLKSNKQLENTAYSKCDQGGKGESETAYPGKNFQRPQIEKSGDTLDGKEITWTITWDPKGLKEMIQEAIGEELISKNNGDVLKALVEKLGDQNKAESFLDNLGIGYEITDKISSSNHKFSDKEQTEKKFSVFEMIYDETTGKYSYTLATTITGAAGETGWENTGEGAGATKSTGKVEKDYPFNYIKSYISDRSTDKLQQTWAIAITNPQVGSESGLLHNNKLEIVFEDTLPAETIYIKGSASVFLSTQQEGQELPDWVTEEKKQAFNSLFSPYLVVDDNDDGTITISYKIQEDDGTMTSFRNSVLAFDFGNSKTGKDFLALTNWNLTIRYDTRVPDGAAFDKLLKDHSSTGSSDKNGIIFKNTVQGTMNGEEGPKREKTTTTYFEQSLNKSNTYINNPDTEDEAYLYSKQPIEDFLNNTGNGPQTMFFEIFINPDRITYTNDGRLLLIDEMGKDLSIIPYSIQLTRFERGQQTTTTVLEEGLVNTNEGNSNTNRFTYSIDSKNNRITFNVPDSQYLVLTYWANVMDNGNGSLDSSNQIEIYGWGNSSRSSSNKEPTPLYPNSTSSSGNVGFSVYKTGLKDGQESVLTGAKFKLEQLTYHPENKEKGDEEFQLDSSSNPSEWEGTPRLSSSSKEEIPGVFDFKDLPKGSIFRLTEIQTPDGYIPSEPIYFIFENYDENIGYTHNTVLSEELLNLTDYNIRVYSYNEQIPIVNRYKETSVSFKGNKEIDGREWDSSLDDGAYSFVLESINRAPMPGEANGASTYSVENSRHDIVFPSITFTESGRYLYKI